jgi:ABC-type multidrug transport system fused ATPase/permease subunit
MPLLQPKTVQTLRELVARARPQRRAFAWVLAFSLLAATSAVIQPLLFKEAVNDVVGVQVKASLDEAVAPAGPSAQHVWAPHRKGRVSPRTTEEALRTLAKVLAALLLLSMLSTYFNYLADDLSARLGAELEQSLVHDAFAHALRLPLRLFDEESSGALAKQVDQVDQVSPIVSIVARTVLPELLRLGGVVAVMLYYSRWLTLIALAPLPLYLLFSARLSKALDRNLEAYYDRWQALSGRIVEVFSGIKTVKQAGAQDREAHRMGADAAKAYRLSVEREHANNRFLAFEELFVQGSRIAVLALGGWLVFHAEQTPGVIVMFVAYIEQLYAPISSLSSLSISLREHAQSSGRALALLRRPVTEAVSGQALAPGPGAMAFDKVRFGYRPGRAVLNGLSFQLEPGTVTALVGPSGAGKTTVVDLLTGLQEPWAGAIRLKGLPLAAIRQQDLRREVAAVSADGAVFSGTVEWNIRYQRPDIPRAQVLAAARSAGLAPLIKRLPKGLASPLGPGGHGLSVGERQRLQLARVLAARPSVLLLDEATANLDFANEMLVKQALQRLRGRCTLLIVAHRWSMVRWADRVLVLRQGKLAQQGPPRALAEKPGWLRHMAQSARSVK